MTRDNAYRLQSHEVGLIIVSVLIGYRFLENII